MSAVKLAETQLQHEKAELLAALRKVVETSGSPEAIAEYLRARGIR